MNSGKTIFSQLMDFIPTYEFRKCIERYNGNYRKPENMGSLFGNFKTY